jgi:CBS domain-containing protein
MSVDDLMSTEVVTMSRNETLDLVDQIMTLGRIRHLPVLDDDGKLCGVVSQRDLFRGALATALGYGRVGQDRLLRSLAVKEVMSTEVVTTSRETPLEDAAKLMFERKLGCLPVVSGGELVGILTESDFVRAFARRADQGASPGGGAPR